MFGIGLDYLIINCNLDTEKVKQMHHFATKDFCFDLQEYSTKNFSKVAKINYKGTPFGVFTYDPYSGSVLKGSFCQLQIENIFLYEGLYWLRGVIMQFFEEFYVKFESFNRIDIALDVQIDKNGTENKRNSPNIPFEDWIFNFERELSSEKTIFAGKSKTVTIHKDTKNVNSGWTFGRRQSDRFIRFYDKSRELREAKNKPHVIEYWKNTCGIFGNVWRFEMQLNRRFLTTITNFEVIFERRYLVEMLRIAMEGFFDPRFNLGYSRITDNEKKETINFDMLFKWAYVKDEKEGDQNQFKKPVRVKDEIHTNNVLRNKILLKKMFFRYMIGEQENILPLVFCSEIFNLGYNFNYREFFDYKIRIWLSQFRTEYNSTTVFCQKTFENHLMFCKGIDLNQ